MGSRYRLSVIEYGGKIESVKNNSVALGRNFTSDGGRSHSWNEVGLANASVSSERRPVIERLVL